MSEHTDRLADLNAHLRGTFTVAGKQVGCVALVAHVDDGDHALINWDDGEITFISVIAGDTFYKDRAHAQRVADEYKEAA